MCLNRNTRHASVRVSNNVIIIIIIQNSYRFPKVYRLLSNFLVSYTYTTFLGGGQWLKKRHFGFHQSMLNRTTGMSVLISPTACQWSERGNDVCSTGTASNTPSTMCKAIDHTCDVIGLRANHLLSSQHLEQRQKIFEHLHPAVDDGTVTSPPVVCVGLRRRSIFRLDRPLGLRIQTRKMAGYTGARIQSSSKVTQRCSGGFVACCLPSRPWQQSLSTLILVTLGFDFKTTFHKKPQLTAILPGCNAGIYSRQNGKMAAHTSSANKKTHPPIKILTVKISPEALGTM